jgi:hypothetical protein
VLWKKPEKRFRHGKEKIANYPNHVEYVLEVGHLQKGTFPKANFQL